MRVRLLWGARAALLAGPTILSFFSGGYFDESRAWAGAIAWALFFIALCAAPAPLPRSAAARATLIGLGLLAVWTLLSTTWAPIAGNAYHAGQIPMLYLGGLLAGVALLRGRSGLRAAELAIGGGAAVVVTYGLSERFLPGLLSFQRSTSALSRLDQPLTYWNAMGELAAIGLVLAVRVAGDSARVRGVRLAATVAAVPLGLGLYVTFSRGALFAALAGLIALAVLCPTRDQWRSGAVALVAAVLGAVAGAPFPGVTALDGTLSAREQDGAIVLGLLVLMAALAAAVQWWLTREEHPGEVRLPRRAPLIALGLIVAGLAFAIVAGAKEKPPKATGAHASRLTSLESNRYAYWSVAMKAFRDEPLHGVGAGGWAVYWLRDRKVNEFAADAHSLPLQTLAELGLVGAGLLAVFVVGGALVAVRAHRRSPPLTAGAIAVLVTYALHAPLDWDWEMPAVTLAALVLLAALIGFDDDAEREAVAPASEATPAGLASAEPLTGLSAQPGM